MNKHLSSPISIQPYLNPQSPPFTNNFFLSKTSSDGLITGRKITNTPLDLSTKDTPNENLSINFYFI